MLQNTFLARYADLLTDLYARSICERGNARVSNYLRGAENVNGRLEIIHTGSLSFRVRKRVRRYPLFRRQYLCTSKSLLYSLLVGNLVDKCAMHTLVPRFTPILLHGLNFTRWKKLFKVRDTLIMKLKWKCPFFLMMRITTPKPIKKNWLLWSTDNLRIELWIVYLINQRTDIEFQHIDFQTCY